MKTKELLIMLRDRIKEKDRLESGLCREISIMCNIDLFTIEDNIELKVYIRNNRPIQGPHFNEEYADCDWFWPLFIVEPRLAWLNYLIEQIQEDENTDNVV